MKNVLVLFFMLFISFRCYSKADWSFPPYPLSSENQNASDPQIAIDPYGNVVAAWVENGYVKSRTQVGGNWSASSTLSNSGASSSRIVIDLNGNATAIWLEGGALKAATQPYNGSWSSATVLESSGASSLQIAIDPSGNVVAVWIKSGIVQSATKLFNESWQSVPDALSDEDSGFPQIAIGANGNVIAVWHAKVGSMDIIFSATKAIGGAWGAVQPISSDSHNAVYPQIAVDLNGNALAVWFRYDFTDSVFSNVVFQAASKLMGENWTFPTDVSSPGIRDPADLMSRVSFDGAGNAIAVWTISFDGSSFVIQSSEKPLNKSWVLPASIGQGLYTYAMDLAVSSVGDAYAVLMSSEFPGPSLSIQVVQSDIPSYIENFWTPGQTLSTGPANGYPRLAVISGTKTYLAAAWINFNGTNNIIESITGTEKFFLPPTNLSVIQDINDLGILKERYNVLSWEASLSEEISGYIVFRNGMLITIADSSTLNFIDHNRKQDESVTYGVAAFNSEGLESPIAYINFSEQETRIQQNQTGWW